jgi:hypothetical protein
VRDNLGALLGVVAELMRLGLEFTGSRLAESYGRAVDRVGKVLAATGLGFAESDMLRQIRFGMAR